MREEIQKSIGHIASNFPFFCVKLKEDQFNILTEKERLKVPQNSKKRKALANSKLNPQMINSKIKITKLGSDLNTSKGTLHIPSPQRRVKFDARKDTFLKTKLIQVTM